MTSEYDEILILIRTGRLEEAKISCETLLEKKNKNSKLYNLYAYTLHSLKYFDESINNFKEAIKIDPYYLDAYNNFGNALVEQGKFDKAITYFSKALAINSKSATAHYGKAFALMKVLKLNEAINHFKETILINPDYANAYNHLGVIFNDLGQWENASENYVKTLSINSKHHSAIQNLINLLTFYNPKKNELNELIHKNNLLRKHNFNFDEKRKISDEEIIDYYNQTIKILTHSLFNFNFREDQIFRRNTVDLNCERHFEVFNTYTVIPEFCFGCYKVQVNPKSILELFKLYIVFDKIKLEKNNIRKCMIELRNSIGGVYKGFIYCSGLEEAKKIFDNISPMLRKIINEKISIEIKRGCSEFSIPYPKFKETSGTMKYDLKWKDKEQIIDKNRKNKTLEKNQENTISGLSLSDALIMKNWLFYAKKVKDLSYEKFKIDLPKVEFIENQLNGQLDMRRKEFQKIINT